LATLAAMRARAGGSARLVLAAGLLACLALASDARARPPDVAARTPIANPGTPAAAASPVSAAALDGKLGGLIRSAGAGGGAWVYEADAKRALFGFHANRARILASNTKLFTTAAAIDRLGADGRLETRVWASGFRDEPQPAPGDGPPDSPPNDGVVDGSLYLVGGGDPALGSGSFAKRNNLPLTNLKELAAEVERAGIERVRGKLRVDANIFDRKRGTGVSGWSRYIGPLSGLTYNSGLGGGDPAMSAGAAFEQLLRKRGVQVSGVARGRVPGELADEQPVAVVRSLELARLVDETNETSNNFFAEMLLKRLDAGKGGVHGSTRGGARRVRRFARGLGSKVRTRDGSGLSRANRASPHSVGKLLAGMLDHDGGKAFADSLPVAGREGTVRGRMRGTAAQGRCRAKTGTLTGVSALSGYCDTGGHKIVFSILMNGTDVAAARVIQDRMVAAIARHG
jgi:D-alanyl-D-alanine carboxypeptidase/D-alanyl-D-alanine-endopeptidase (penicillin-binding protein 4)